jgi:hypothetical protein
MHDHTFTTGEESIKKRKVYQLYGYPKRYKYKKPRWECLGTENDISSLMKNICSRYRFKGEPYVFKISELNIETKFKPVKMEKIMVLRIKEGL